MPVHFADLASLKGTRDTSVAICGYTWQVFPVTAAVILGPLIAVAYNLTQPVHMRAGDFGVGQAARGFLCALMLLALFCSGGLRPLTHRLVRPLLFLTTYALVTSLLGPYPYHHVVFAGKMAFLTVVFASALHLAGKGLVSERWLTICAWVVLITTATCLGIALIAGSPSPGYTSRYASAGLMNHVGTTSAFLLSTLPVFLRGMTVGHSAVAGVAILYESLFFTMRRSALIATAVATACSFLIDLSPLGGRVPWRRTLVSLAILLVLIGIGLSTTAGTDLTARFRDLNPHEGTGSGRYVFWRITLAHILDRSLHTQIYGEGMGSIKDLLRERFGLSIGSHNDWLDLTYAFGLFGLIGLGWWYFEVIRFARRLCHEHEGLLQGVCASVIVLGLISLGTGGGFEPPWALTYAAMGFWAGHTLYAKPSRRSRKDREPVLETQRAGCPVH